MLDKIKSIIRKAKVVATSVVAKLTVVGTVLTTVALFAGDYAEVPVVGAAVPYLTIAIGIVATLAKIVSVVAEVPEDLVGLEPATKTDLALSFANLADEQERDDEFWINLV